VGDGLACILIVCRMLRESTKSSFRPPVVNRFHQSLSSLNSMLLCPGFVISFHVPCYLLIWLTRHLAAKSKKSPVLLTWA
jgi:hypothetical protein